MSDQTLLIKKELSIGKWVLGVVFALYIGAIIKEGFEDKKIKNKTEQSYNKSN